MTANPLKRNYKVGKLSPFLIRFAQDSILTDNHNRKILRVSGTIVTRVQRETTDDN